MEPLTDDEKTRLAQAVEANNSAQQFMYGRRSDFQSLIDRELVAIREDLKDGKGANLTFGIRATEAGKRVFMELSGGPAVTVQAPAGAVEQGKRSFVIDRGMPVPRIKRRDSETSYPFDKLEVGDNFHVPATEEVPTPAKSLASSVTQANRRFAKEIPGTHRSKDITRKGKLYPGKDIPNYELTRKFIVREVGEDDPRGPGARVYRVELPKNASVTASSPMDDDGDDDNGGGEE